MLVTTRLVAQVALAQATFEVPADALKTWLGGAQRVAVYASAGHPEADDAAGEVAQACRALQLTLAQPIEQTPLEPQALAKLARPLKLDALLLVRTVKDTPGQVVLTVLDANGQAKGNVLFGVGHPLPARAPRPAARGVDVPLVHQGLSIGASAQQLYSGADFYRALGRDDLAERFVRLAWTRGVVLGVGALALVAGFIVAYEGFSQAPCAGNQRYCSADQAARITGISLGSGGLIALLVGTLLSVHPASAVEQAGLVAAHNAALLRPQE
jgi:hypothetical protein